MSQSLSIRIHKKNKTRRAIYNFIKLHLTEYEYGPTYEQISECCDMSKSHVKYHLDILRQLKLVDFNNSPRSIRIYNLDKQEIQDDKNHMFRIAHELEKAATFYRNVGNKHIKPHNDEFKNVAENIIKILIDEWI